MNHESVQGKMPLFGQLRSPCSVRSLHRVSQYNLRESFSLFLFKKFSEEKFETSRGLSLCKTSDFIVHIFEQA